MSQKGSQLEFYLDDVSSYMELNSTEKVQEFHCKIYPNDFEVNGFEKNSYSNLSTSEIMQKIDGYHLINYANELRKTKIDLIVPELNYLLASFEENIIDNILHGNALLINYYYEITKIIINLILTNSNKVDINIIRKNRRGNEKMEGKEEKSGKISKEEKKKKTLDESEEVRLLDIRRIFL
ncbi:hypothetical protein CWI36_0494p0010 [Hamiltosporidium magnivora]|uniref:Uncharacterized protein n=1 Tax=Hamiltosporidium magnivora TaxID=148818 RepID=A0A4Q9LE32_9MICR|nr:hypothetical protein CWI36_0494p0010 [Hamiltosporidium magnivora]